jgi:hypothetical protein
MSISHFSAVTEAELLEARGMEIYPHNNTSVLMVHNGTQETEASGQSEDNAVQRTEAGTTKPVFEAYVQEPVMSDTELDKPRYSADSALINPRAAPEPPTLVFIPPTPVDDPDRQIFAPDKPRDQMQRRPSLKDRVRRYSENLVQPFPFGRSGSYRRHSLQHQRPQTSPADRPTYLSSFWQPREFWEDYDSSDDEDDFLEGEARLPPGGDTSDILERRNSLLPRSMSVRMPGFRGRGGFLQGNSLGLDRHGTNTRRHYVVKRNSEEALQRAAEQRRRRTFTLPFTGGTRVEYVGLVAVSARFKESMARRKEQTQEKRREKLREQIGPRVYSGVVRST